MMMMMEMMMIMMMMMLMMMEILMISTPTCLAALTQRAWARPHLSPPD